MRTAEPRITAGVASVVPKRRDPQEDAPLSRSQQALWFTSRLTGDGAALNLPSAVRLLGALDVDALRRALGALRARHEILRTVFPAIGGRPVQRILPASPAPFELEVVDCTDGSDDEREARAKRLGSAKAQEPFDLAEGPLWRGALYRLGAEDHLLVLVFHHLVWDGWSIGVFSAELRLCYAAFLAGEAPPLPPPALQFADYAAHESELLAGPAMEKGLAFWEQALAGVPELSLPLDRPRTASQRLPGDMVEVTVPEPIVRALDEVRGRADATTFQAALAAFAIVLGRHADQASFAIGVPVANRSHGELSGVIGPLANIVVLPIDLGGDPSFTALLRRVRRATLDAYAQQHVPFERVVDRLHVARDPSKNPLFQVMFAQHAEVLGGGGDFGAGLRAVPSGVAAEVSHFDLGLHLWRRDRTLTGYCAFNKDLFDTATIERLVACFGEALAAALAAPDAPISTLEIVPESARSSRESDAALRDADGVSGEVIRTDPEGLLAIDETRALAGILVGDGHLPVAGADAALRRLGCPIASVIAPPEIGAEIVRARRRPGEPPAFDPAGYKGSIEVRDRHGRRCPIGVAGALVVDGVRTGDRVRQRSDGLVEVLGSLPGYFWSRAGRVDLDAVARRLASAPFVHEAFVRARPAIATEEVVAWVVPSQKVERARIEERLAGLVEGRTAVVLVDRLPRDRWGRLDERALLAMPVLDAESLARFAPQVAASFGADRAAAAVIAAERDAAPLHVSDLTPWVDGAGGTCGAAAPALIGSGTGTSGVEAYVKGPPLVVPEGAARTMTEAFRRLALSERGSERGLLLIAADGSREQKTYRDLWEAGLRVAGGLRARGLGPGSRVIVHTAPLFETFAAFWGAVLAGATPVLVARAPDHEKRNAVLAKLWNVWSLLREPAVIAVAADTDRVARSAALYAGASASPAVWAIEELLAAGPAAEPHEPAPEDVCFLQLTSGSTGVPKCIQETHRAVVCHAISVAKHNSYSEADVTLNFLPLDHVMSMLTAHLKDLYWGARQIHVETSHLLAEPLRLLDLVEEHRVTHTASPNFLYKLLDDALSRSPGRTWDLSSMKLFLNGGEQVTLPVLAAFLARTAPFGVRPGMMQPAFGMAEAATGIAYSNDFSLETAGFSAAKSSLGGALSEAGPGEESVFFTDLGPPVPGVEIRIADAEGHVLPERVIGRLQLRGPTITPGYLDNEEANRAAFTPDGWFDTGDLGFLHRGRLSVTGREKETIIIRGANFFCYEIEDIAGAIEGVEPTFVAACAVRDETAATEGLAIAFVPRAGASEAAVGRAIRDRITRELGVAPALLIPVSREELPKTTSGKIQRKSLERAIAAGAFSARLRGLDLAERNERTVPRWFHRWAYRRVESDSLRPLPCDRRIVVSAGGPFAEAVGRLLGADVVHATVGPAFERLDRTRYKVRADSEEDLTALFEAVGGPIGQIVHLLSHGPEPSIGSVEDLRAAQVRGAESVQALVRALALSQPERACRVLVVTEGLACVNDSDRPALSRGPLRGLCRSVAQELPFIEVRLADVHGADVAAVGAELQATPEPEVAWRDGRRWAPRLTELGERDFAASAGPVRLPFSRGDTVLVTGGLGGVGVRLARALLGAGARVALVGRTRLDTNGAAIHEGNGSEAGTDAGHERLGARAGVAERRAALRELQALGDVSYHVADVTSLNGMLSVINAVEAAHDRPLAGAIHLAGDLPARLVAEQTGAALWATVAPKLAGAWVLDRLLGERAFLVSFGSVYGGMGGATGSAYAAACAGLDGFSAWRRAEGRAQTACLSFSNWDGVGLSADYAFREQSIVRGYAMLDPRRAVTSTLALLGRPLTETVVGLDARWPNVARYVAGAAAPIEQLAVFTIGGADGSGPSLPALCDRFGAAVTPERISVSEIPRTPSGEPDVAALALAARPAGRRGTPLLPRTGLERAIASAFQKVLEIETIEIDQTFFELGGQSVLLVRLLSVLETTLGKKLTVLELLRYPTIRALAEHLSEKPAPTARFTQAKDRAAKQRQALRERIERARPARKDIA